jgi:hypothetical protein
MSATSFNTSDDTPLSLLVDLVGCPIGNCCFESIAYDYLKLVGFDGGVGGALVRLFDDVAAAHAEDAFGESEKVIKHVGDILRALRHSPNISVSRAPYGLGFRVRVQG